MLNPLLGQMDRYFPVLSVDMMRAEVEVEGVGGYVMRIGRTSQSRLIVSSLSRIAARD